MKKTLLFALLTCWLTLSATDTSWEEYKTKVLSHQQEVHGWCTEEKAEKMMDLIYETSPKVCVEIGVFGGASIYPTASALKYLKTGVVHAIDPWSHEACQEGYTPDQANYTWWTEVDLEEILVNFRAMLFRFGIAPWCKVMQMSSEEALSHFEDESIDILHIDGNHSEEASLKDVLMFLPKLKKGGYLWFDDVDWGSTTKTVEYLSEHCTFQPDRSISTCFLFQKK